MKALSKTNQEKAFAHVWIHSAHAQNKETYFKIDPWFNFFIFVILERFFLQKVSLASVVRCLGFTFLNFILKMLKI